MRLCTAVLKKTVTDDGLCGVQDHIQPGAVYFVDLSSRRPLSWGDLDHRVSVTRESIYCDAAENGTAPGWMPVELLDIHTEPVWPC